MTVKVITCHINPDFDAIASCIAAKKLYPESEIVFPELNRRLTKNFMVQSIIYSYNTDGTKINLKDIDTLIIVDTHSKNRIGVFANILDSAKIICYDHHEDGDIECSEMYKTKTGANTTQIVSKIIEKNISITEDEATLFMLGIYEDTGKLLYNSTMPEDFSICSYLRKSGADLDIVSNVLEENLTETDVALLNEMVKNKRIYEINSNKILLSFTSSDIYVSDVSSLVTKILKINGVNAAICMFRMGSKIYVIGRSKDNGIDLLKIFKEFGGSGHKQAASAVIKNMTLIETTEVVSLAIKSEMLNNIKAKDIMSFPPKFIDSNKSIKDANDIMSKFSINALAVLKNDEVVGIITRQTVQRALYHNLNNESVENFMNTEFEVVDGEETFSKIKDIVINKNQRLIPVLSNDKLVGVITRTNLLKLITENIKRESFINPPNIKAKLKKSLPYKVYEYLLASGHIAEQMGINVYVVGGIVRDIMLGLNNLDVDLVVEENGIAFAKELAKKYQARVASHERFKTATIIFKDKFRIDVATARREYYEIPGSLPIVEKSSIKLDLYRRDFTINTLAVKLNDDFGQLLDFFGGLRDIKDKKIRVLHDLSFIEDPTRILRAVRFAARFGFNIGKQTEKLIKTTINLGILNNVEKNRIFKEMVFIFNSSNVEDAFNTMSKYLILRNLNKKLIVDGRLLQFIRKAEDVIRGYSIFFKHKKIKKELVYIIMMEYLFKKSLSFSETIGADEKTVNLAKTISSEINAIKAAVTNEKTTNIDIYYTLEKIPIEVILVVFVVSDEHRNISRYLEHLMNQRHFISGKDLINLGFKPSPIFSQIMSDVFNLQLMGEIKDKLEAIKYVKEKYIDHEQKNS